MHAAHLSSLHHPLPPYYRLLVTLSCFAQGEGDMSEDLDGAGQEDGEGVGAGRGGAGGRRARAAGAGEGGGRPPKRNKNDQQRRQEYIQVTCRSC